MTETKPGDTVYKDDELLKKEDLQSKLINEFRDKYQPTDSPVGCDLKTTWEIVDMFSGITDVDKETVSNTLNQLGFKMKLIGDEFRWLLSPRF